MHNKNVLDKMIEKITPLFLTEVWAWTYGMTLMYGINNYYSQYHFIDLHGWACIASGFIMIGFLLAQFLHSLKLILCSFLMLVIPIFIIMVLDGAFPAWGLEKALLKPYSNELPSRLK